MNEKFFDLRKEKQDRIMGAAMEVFAQCGYEHASTDDMVKRAHISKGLLFHYFGSKLGLYTFLYDYSVRFMTMQFARTIPEGERDYFRLQEYLLEAWSDAMRQYPYIRLFLMGADEETDEEALKEITDKRDAYSQTLSDIAARYDEKPFKRDAPVEMVSNMVWYALAGLLKDMDKEEEGWQDTYVEVARAYLDMMRRISCR
ncbi:MAG: TetR/AcrR family transcriptional regulator [Lachnospiraceae bacterium]|nr:TetR/AcrR family transcriptional regulator [Lachnospiraceae bacterium]